ncbi:unnamed protein product, partial [Effrenium voratum]
RLLLLLLPLARAQVLNLVLSRYIDSTCSTLDSGEGVTQNWALVPLQNSICYDVSVGLSCSFRCNLKLTCEYASGSGVMLEDYTEAGCNGVQTARVPMARHLTWLGAVDLFNGQCTPTGDGAVLRRDGQMRSRPRRKANL